VVVDTLSRRKHRVSPQSSAHHEGVREGDVYGVVCIIALWNGVVGGGVCVECGHW
jgi:hypothetical protein